MELSSRPLTTVGAVVTLAATAFAVGAAVTSSDDGAGAGAAGGGSTTSSQAAAAPAPPAAPRPSPTATARFDIEIVNFQFAVPDAVVEIGTEVVWTNNDPQPHSVVSDDDGFVSSESFNTGETYATVFTEPGTYPYHCGLHENMVATITVQG